MGTRIRWDRRVILPAQFGDAESNRRTRRIAAMQASSKGDSVLGMLAIAAAVAVIMVAVLAG